MLRVAIIVILLALLPSHALSEARIALLITNAAYPVEVGALANPLRAGDVIATALQSVGFERRRGRR